jgi:hypothetical protein
MPRFETAYAKLVGRLVADLVSLARAVAKEELKVARAAQAERARMMPKIPKVSARLQRALERAEEARKRAAERRAQAIAARAARADVRRPEKISRPSRALESTAPAPVVPPPLFVHKRSRDGSIQTLERGRDSVPPPPPA